MRTAAHFLSYETASALALVSALLTGSLSMNEIVQAQLDQGQWFVYVPVGFGIFFLASIALTYRTAIAMQNPIRKSLTGSKNRARSDSLGPRFAHRLHPNLCGCGGYLGFLGGWPRPLA